MRGPIIWFIVALTCYINIAVVKAEPDNTPTWDTDFDLAQAAENAERSHGRSAEESDLDALADPSRTVDLAKIDLTRQHNVDLGHLTDLLNLDLDIEDQVKSEERRDSHRVKAARVPRQHHDRVHVKPNTTVELGSNKRPCDTANCQNSAMCINVGTDHFICKCSQLFQGPTCSESIFLPKPYDDHVKCRKHCKHGGCHKGHGGVYICRCSGGWIGPSCQMNEEVEREKFLSWMKTDDTNLWDQVKHSAAQSVCQKSECSHYGVCVVTSADTYRCHCPPAYNGKYCEHRRHMHCLDNPCENGGTCEEMGPDHIRCRCKEGFTGPVCSVEETNAPSEGCSSQPCRNGGTCKVTREGGFYCECPEGFSGDTCVEEGEGGAMCLDHPCKNGATCTTTGSNSFICKCTKGFTGELCDVTHHGSLNATQEQNPPVEQNTDEERPGDVTQRPTDKTPSEQKPTAQTPTGEQKPTLAATTDRNPVTSKPVEIKPTEAKPAEQKPVTQKPEGGKPAEQKPTEQEPGGTKPAEQKPATARPAVDVPEIGNLVQQNSTVVNPEHHRPGKQNDTEAEQRNPCAGHKCGKHGVCYAADKSGYVCICEENFTGPYCENMARACEGNPCGEHGDCKAKGDNFTCLCNPGYSGLHCNQTVTCLTKPCVNSGTCLESSTGYRCHCIQGYGGNWCEQLVDSCARSECKNGATCVSQAESTGYTCVCLRGYMGVKCEHVDMCDPNPCKNDGNCTMLLTGHGYQCDCDPAYTGDNCEKSRKPWPRYERIEPAVLNRGKRSAEVLGTCVEHRCQHEGICLQRVDGPVCVCMPGYHGDRCDVKTEVDRCTGRTCRHAGICQNTASEPTCLCPVAFSGAHCEQFRDPCASRPCAQPYKCHVLRKDLVLGYRCIDPSKPLAEQLEKPKFTQHARNMTMAQVDNTKGLSIVLVLCTGLLFFALVSMYISSYKKVQVEGGTVVSRYLSPHGGWVNRMRPASGKYADMDQLLNEEKEIFS